MKQSLLEYYKTVQEYHRIAEESHANETVSAELLLRYINPSGIILDIGGGTGFNAEFLRLSSETYVSVDASLTGLRMMKGKGRGSAVQMDVAQLGIKSGVVGVVLCSYSLEHFPEPDTVLNEMIRITKKGGQIVIWSPNWDNIFRINFPQFAHKSKSFVEKVRWKIFFNMVRNEFLPFRYRPFVSLDVAALTQPEKYVSWDSDAVHCALCQETYKWFKQNGCRIVHVSDLAEVPSYVRNDALTRIARRVLRSLLPILRRAPLLRWFVIRFPIVVEKSFGDSEGGKR
jgi:ubiquinone/menaquinone biosynthesis C-methylase UbiE